MNTSHVVILDLSVVSFELFIRVAALSLATLNAERLHT
jgi:hypothetical protein